MALLLYSCLQISNRSKLACSAVRRWIAAELSRRQKVIFSSRSDSPEQANAVNSVLQQQAICTSPLVSTPGRGPGLSYWGRAATQLWPSASVWSVDPAAPLALSCTRMTQCLLHPRFLVSSSPAVQAKCNTQQAQWTKIMVLT